MNILILFSQPWRVGGAETHVKALIAGLEACNHQVYLAVNRGSDQQQLDNLMNEFPHLQLLTIQARGVNILAWIASIKKLADWIQRENIDVISAQQRTAGLWAWLLHKKTGRPFTVTMHDSWHRVLGAKHYARIFPEMIVVSRNLENRLIRDFDFSPTAIHFIQNGIDFTKFIDRSSDEAKKELALAVDQPLLLHVSRLSSIKGAVAIALLESLELVLKKWPKLQVVIIGEGPLRAVVEEKANEVNQKMGQVVSIHPFTDQIVTWYQAADLVIGEGRVAIESLACARPVVAIRNGQTFFGAVTPDNLEESMSVNFDGQNWPVTPENLVQELEMAVNLSHDSCTQITNRLKKRMSLEIMSNQYMELFQKMVEEKP